MSIVIVAGASGQHAGVVYEAAMLAGLNVAGFITIDQCAPPEVLDCTYLGGPELLGDARLNGASFVPACGSNARRKQATDAIVARGAALQTVIHPKAIVSPSAVIGAGAVVLAGAIVGPSAWLGRVSIVNHGASVDHDCEIGDFANICPGARLAGAVHVGDGAFIGLNAAILPGIRIGEDAVVGAGAVVVEDVAARYTAIGIPARATPSNGRGT